VLFALGFLWLLTLGAGAAWLEPGNLVGSAFAKAVQPFLVWDGLKMLFAALTVTGIFTLAKRRS
jgi:biotin transport system substrate-specific component